MLARSVPRPRPLQKSGLANKRPAGYREPVLRWRNHLQTRSFRFFTWPTCKGSISHLQIRRRKRYYKYADSINRRATLYDFAFAEKLDGAEKRVGQFWTSTASTITSLLTHHDNLGKHNAHIRCHSGKASSSNARPNDAGPRAQELYRTAGERPWKTPANVESSSRTSGQRKNVKPQEKGTLAQDPTVETDYIIDPITNRKVPKNDPDFIELSLDSLPQDLNVSGFQSTSQESPAIRSNGVPPASELSKYAESNFDDWSTTSKVESTKSSSQTEASHYSLNNSDLKSGEYALNHLPLDDPIEEAEDVHEPQATSPVTKKSGRQVAPNSEDVPSGHDNASSRRILESSRLESELGKYGSHVPNEYIHEHGSSKEPNDLDKYRPSAFDEIKNDDQTSQKEEDLGRYQTLSFQDFVPENALEQDITRKCLEEYDTKAQNEDALGSITQPLSTVSGKLPKMELPEGHLFSRHGPAGSKVDVGRLPRDRLRSRAELARDVEHLGKISDEIDREVNRSLREGRQGPNKERAASIPPPITGNFARDFPSEFQESWNIHESGLLPRRDRPSQLEHPAYAAQEEGKQNFEPASARRPTNFKLEPALNRRASAITCQRPNRAFGADLYSKEPQGLETSFVEECGGRHTMPLYTRTYGSEPGQVSATSTTLKQSKGNEKQAVESESSTGAFYERDPEIDGVPPPAPQEKKQHQENTEPAEPTLYKILAYDPDMQAVTVAETVSSIPDQASPLTPTDVLPRLSNPTKFLPHFALLRDEGFEMVAGSGNILVFRQVRPAKAAEKSNGPPVNPIDMMGRPAALPNAAAFVSPTGFVNYDIPRVEEDSTEPTFQSNTNVRREEHVFSGQKTSSSGRRNKRSKASAGKRVLIGGVWVAGVSYALTVIAEYFSTGGVDGTGPTGF
ncbi:hypothetical protein GGS20DRAFT_532320 [Poronia punctata]|nr:hypothetical protein GGS20DRAFT_532320 [Poronia punctata]